MATPRAPVVLSTEPRGLLEFSGVVTQPDGAVLAPLTVRSHCAFPLSVGLASSVGGSVTFQLENENLRGAEGEEDDPDDWNLLFNEIGHVTSVDLPPNGEAKLVVSFRPAASRGSPTGEEDSDARGGGAMGVRSAHGANVHFAEPASFRERHAIQEARASILLTAVPQSELPTATEHAAAAAAAAQPQPLAPPLEVGLLARHCRSVLRVDEHEVRAEPGYSKERDA